MFYINWFHLTTSRHLYWRHSQWYSISLNITITVHSNCSVVSPFYSVNPLILHALECARRQASR